jgi:type I restriction enzyme, R subunit
VTRITEDAIEQTPLAWMENLGSEIAHGPDVAFDGPTPERDAEANHTDVVLIGRLSNALGRIHPCLLDDAFEEAVRQVNKKAPHEKNLTSSLR